ncbi:lorien protein [Trypanosoma theileri]|uniref:Lorien protein n=1 Tax=Trypanosoma theileri TaxID=67003 RepID=A0A1X0P185_9TRYP|nr:lorien protein [Trypanosoma theileri]ORC90704.1 lorien protein [Trypanosoma theileri]
MTISYKLGTPLWVKCDDGEWWPAVVREADEELLLLVGGGYDMCVEFYHDPGNLYPLVASDDGIRLFHHSESERDAEEQKFFLVKATQDAVQKAFQDFDRNADSRKVVVPYNARELHCMSALLQSVNHNTALDLRRALEQQEGINLSPRKNKRVGDNERKKRKRSINKISGDMTTHHNDLKVGLSDEESSYWPIEPSTRTGITTTTTTLSSSVALSETATGNATAIESTGSSIPRVSHVEGKELFCEPFTPAALDVLRKEVFEDKDRLILSPLYRYLEVLGAVAVDGVPLQTTLPSPLALCEVPEGGFPPSRRVLLVALSASTFDHTDGWMVPFEYEDSTISMTLSVNDNLIETPCNPSLPSGKEMLAVKTAPVADITSYVIREELFSLKVGFTGFLEDAALWNGIIVAVYADELDMDLLVNRIVSNYQMPPRRRKRDSVVGVQVKIVCPITTLPLEIPVRGFSCEHMQCMELRSLLVHCIRTNVWNCPLCWSPTLPRTIIVNYRLKEWLETHQSQISEVEFIVETPSGGPLQPIWRQKSSRKIADVIAVE